MKLKIMCQSGPNGGDIRVDAPVDEAKAVFDRLTGRSTSLPEGLCDRLGLKEVRGINSGSRLSYVVAKSRPGGIPEVVKNFEELSPDDALILMPPQVGG